MLTTVRQRLASLPREARDTLFLLAVIGWVVLPHVAHLPWWCSLLTAGVLAWRARLAVTGRPLPGKWWLGALIVIALAATLATHRTVLGRDAGVTLIVVLLALKTLELRARRDAFVVFFLGFFAMLTNFFFSQSLLTAGAMMLALLGLLTALVNAHMPAGRPTLLEAAKIAGRMALLGAPIMAALFVLFPRFAPLWGIPNDAMTGRSGLSSTIEVGNVASLALDDSIAFRIKFEGQPPRRETLYFRGPVLSQFDGRQWRAFDARPDAAVASFAVRTSRLEVQGPPVRYEVTLEPHNRPWLLLLDAASRPPLAGGAEVFMTPDLQWVSARPVVDLLRYRAESHAAFRHGPERRIQVPSDYTRLPADFNPRTRAMAREIQQAHPGNRTAQVQEALTRLRTGGYLYTLEPGVYGTHTADEFWFDRKQGFCEHIASAFVILLRGMDIPARIVTGYQGGDINAVDGFWTIRQSDAHAWAEVWLEGQGWARIDPTSYVAPTRIGSLQRLQPTPGFLAGAFAATVDPTLLANFRAAWEALNNSWNQWVLNYTQSKQLDLLKNLGFTSPSWEDLSYVLLALIVAAAIIGAAWTYWERTQHDPWLRLLARARRRLARQGVNLPPSAPPRQVAAAVTTRFGADARALADWLLRLEDVRYAREPREGLAALRRDYKQLAWPQ
jgi:transglutaminase-like putative cysteine protease